MEITEMKMETYRWPPTGLSSSGRWIFGNDGLDVIRVETSQGVTGIGPSWSVGQADSIGRNLAEHYRHLALGQNPLDTEKIWERMWQDGGLGRRGVATRVISAIDIAIWDIKGKVCGLPLFKLLGGYTDRVPAYISLGYRGQQLAEVIACLEKGVSDGARAIKMQIGELSSIKEEVERVQIARETIGSDVKLMLDTRCAYSYHDAILLASAVEKYDIYWLEEPVKVDDLKGHQLVARATSIPIAAGEGEYTKYGFRDLIESGGAAILQPDAMIMGGITEWMKVAAMAQAHHLPMSHHGPHQVHAHLLAAIPNGLMVEEYYSSETEPIAGGIFKEILKIVEGHIHPPDRPGLGLELNDEALAPYRTG